MNPIDNLNVVAWRDVKDSGSEIRVNLSTGLAIYALGLDLFYSLAHGITLTPMFSSVS